ncbi:MAG: uncharacterized protein KVP18_004302 [Porospora cf. gigantea A]|uniref:uncharacterized protein n=1 Tax=Porospora cf. gigantea A TaxID=2853593 RepID=UPI003559DD4F|nr:MAG: hypothetical protein KVP18_004302 [Porospora cf. gigantea A]
MPFRVSEDPVEENIVHLNADIKRLFKADATDANATKFTDNPSRWNIVADFIHSANEEKTPYHDKLFGPNIESESRFSHEEPADLDMVSLPELPRIFLTKKDKAEIFDVVQELAKVMLLRDEFIVRFCCRESPFVQERQSRGSVRGEISTEPEFARKGDLDMPLNTAATSEMVNGVLNIYFDPENPFIETDRLLWEDRWLPSADKYLSAIFDVMKAVTHPAVKAYCYNRLKIMQNRFELHVAYNSKKEQMIVKNNPHRDFYNVRKVDTHIHHSACMHQKHLLRFIRHKFHHSGDEVVKIGPEGPMTLKAVFAHEMNQSAWETSLDHLDVSALGSCFHRFDVFNHKYNPFGLSTLREVFLKTDNHLQGKYLAEITQEVINQYEEEKYQYYEWRVSIYGKAPNEWQKLASWMRKNALQSANVRWLVQVPRLYSVYRRVGVVKSFADWLYNVFHPLFEAIARPQEHPDIFWMLQNVVGWDSVDDESKATTTSDFPPPEEWTRTENPPYHYYMYYMFANIRVLNLFLNARGMRTLSFRPHCGEAGNISHLGSCFLLADGINHGILLKKSPCLQYLYYLKQIPIAMSPLSNNALFLELEKNPLPIFFKRGLNVSLSSDDPLMFHFTKEPLLEEYSVVAHTYKLTPVDLCELARNSCLHSGFEPRMKRHWLGENYNIGPDGNDLSKTNVPLMRLMYRRDVLYEEVGLLREVLKASGDEESATCISVSPMSVTPSG